MQAPQMGMPNGGFDPNMNMGMPMGGPMDNGMMGYPQNNFNQMPNGQF